MKLFLIRFIIALNLSQVVEDVVSEMENKINENHKH
jgi:hypothetical protein